MTKSSPKIKKDMSKVQNDLNQLGSRFTRILLVIVAVLFVLEFVIHRHGETHLEENFMFPAIYGFVAFVLIVEIGKILRRLIMRGENYYGDNNNNNNDDDEGGENSHVR